MFFVFKSVNGCWLEFKFIVVGCISKCFDVFMILVFVMVEYDLFDVGSSCMFGD